MGQLSEREIEILIIIERITASISVLGTLALFATFIFIKSFRTLSNTIIFYASFANLFANVAALIGGSALSKVNSPLCQFQGFLLEMFMQSDPWWSLAMATNVYLVFFYRYDAAQLKKLYPYYALICYGLPFIPAMVCLFVKTKKRGRIYGNATLWCWIDGSWAPLRIYSYYTPIWLTILAALIIYVRVGIYVFHTRNQLHGFAHKSDPSLPTDTGGKSPIPLQNTISNTSEATNKEYESEHDQPIFTGTRTTEIEVTHGSWENGIAINTGPISENPDPSDLNPMAAPTKNPDTNYRVTISALPRINTTMGRESRRGTAHSFDRIKWAYAKCAILFSISILVTWVPASVNRVYGLRFPDNPSFILNIGSALVLPLQGFWNTIIYFTTSLGICRSVWADFRGPSNQHKRSEGFRVMDRPMTGNRRAEMKETESMVELSTSRSHTTRSVSADCDRI